MSQATTLRPGCSFLAQPPTVTFSPEDFNSEEQLMIRTAEAFSKHEVLPALDRIDQQEDGLMPSLIKRAGELGLCGVDAPEAYGGLGLGKNLAARILEFMSLNASFSVTFGITSGISQVGLALFGSEAQKQYFLPGLTSGEQIGAYALSEPNSGSDALSMTTRASRNGGGWVLNGTKMWISNAKWAHLFLVMARSEEGVSAFLVERNRPGLSIGREEHKLGLKGSSTARVELDHVEVPEENLLYEPGKGHHVAFNALNLGRFKLASMSIGPCRDAIANAVQYAKDRKQFGQPLADFGLIRKKLAQAAAIYYVAESMTYRTGAMIDDAFAAAEPSIAGNRAAAEEYAVECSACKVFATEAEAWIVDEMLQVYGGYGFTEEFPLARHYRDARVSRIYEGTNEINRLFVADRFQRRIREGRVADQLEETGFIASLVPAALSRPLEDQVHAGAASDLLILAYAEQSARLRARKNGAFMHALYRVALDILEVRAADAYRTLTGEAVTLPKRETPPLSEVAEDVLTSAGVRT